MGGNIRYKVEEIMEKLLFCNIGWMNNYQGITDDDTEINSGGAYNDENIGHEVCNFLNCNGICYGYVQPVKSGEIKLEKIYGIKPTDILDKGKKIERVENITVVWMANSRIVGWYKNAIIYRNPQDTKLYMSKTHKKNNVRTFRIKAYSEDVTLLPVEERNFSVPSSNPSKQKIGKGRSNIWYANHNIVTDKWLENENIYVNETKKFRKKVFKYINNTNTFVDIYDREYFEAIEGVRENAQSTRISRSTDLVNKKKNRVLKDKGKIICEACGFDFKKVYGEIGEKFCEVHHKKPLSQRHEHTITSLDDLAILCSNCHSMIHKTQPILSIDKFKRLINIKYMKVLYDL